MDIYCDTYEHNKLEVKRQEHYNSCLSIRN